MAAKMRPVRRNFSGEFRAQATARGAWRIFQSQPRSIDIFVRGAGAEAAQALADKPLRSLAVDWHEGGAQLSVEAAGRPAVVAASSLVVHEPLQRLYDALPLAVFDAGAQRFWSRVFTIVRLPGGRQLLRCIARSGRRGS